MITRRDFLKLSSLISGLLLSSKFNIQDARFSTPSKGGDSPGVIIMVFDSLSASNMSLFGYPRQTTPSLERFAERCLVYHQHYSAATFTTASTASLLTGTHPWSNRAFQYAGKIASNREAFNIFHEITRREKVVFSQNPWASMVLRQLRPWFDRGFIAESFSKTDNTTYNELLRHDALLAYHGIEDYAFQLENPYAASTLLSLVRKLAILHKDQKLNAEYQDEYPMGLPQTMGEAGSRFLLEDLLNGLLSIIQGLKKSSLVYLHSFPPHFPYAPKREGLQKFYNDGWKPIRKPSHPFAKGVSDYILQNLRYLYDSYIFSLDQEFGRLIENMEKAKIFDNYYVIFTSDHGELFERGEHGHTNPFLYEPLVHVPLLISVPGSRTRVDITVPTSSVDILPTILSLSGLPSPSFCEGSILPELGGVANPDRPIYFMDSKSTPAAGQIKKATLGIRKGQYKGIRYYGYEGLEDSMELYDMEKDPEELINLSPKAELANDIRMELDKKLDEVNQAFTS